MKSTILSVMFLLISYCLFAQDGKVNFNAQFKKENSGKYKIEINEIKELIHIMIAITKSGFRTFYSNYSAYYKTIVSDYEKNANLNKQWKWLEENFKTRISSYQILCSPLINGLNYTGAYKSGSFELIQMVLPPIDHNEKWTEHYTEALNTKGMFTEIDHNYVRAPSDKYEKEINEALKDRAKWVDTKMYGTEYYQNPVKVFNEYMTFGVFILYCEDIFKNDPETLKAMYNDVTGVMTTQRGFTKMTGFTDQLMSLRKKYKHSKIDELYPELLKWCAGQ